MSSNIGPVHFNWQSVVRWLAAALAAFAVVLPNGSQPAAALLLLLVLPAFFVGRARTLTTSRLWLLMLLTPVVTSIPLFVTSGTGEALEAGSRYFAAAIVFLALSRFELDHRLLLRAASLGGILAILFNLHQLGEMRVNWGVGFLDSGYISVMLLSLAFAQFHLDRGRTAWRIFSVVGIVCLVIAVMKTGTRGAWPAMIFVFLLQFVLLEISRKRKILLAVTGSVVLAAAVLYMPSVKQRISLTLYEFQSYYQENNRATSMGYRLDFWSIAINCFAESPVWGVSYQRRSELMAQYIEANPESRTIGTDGRSSSHNEMLDALAKRGVLGGLAVLLLYLVPLRFFIRHVGSGQSSTVRYLALSGGGLVTTMIICGITEAPLMNFRVGTSYAFLIVFLYHLIRRASDSTGLESGSNPSRVGAKSKSST